METQSEEEERQNTQPTSTEEYDSDGRSEFLNSSQDVKNIYEEEEEEEEEEEAEGPEQQDEVQHNGRQKVQKPKNKQINPPKSNSTPNKKEISSNTSRICPTCINVPFDLPKEFYFLWAIGNTKQFSQPAIKEN